MSLLCPCCSHQNYTTCCEPYLLGQRFPDTPEKLMRSRYTAYSLGNIAYIEQTMRGKASLHFERESAKNWSLSVIWLSLEVVKAHDQVVEFKARFLEGQSVRTIHEISLFEHMENRWFYVDGQVQKTPDVKVSRNAVCPCGSGRKFKNCHG